MKFFVAIVIILLFSLFMPFFPFFCVLSDWFSTYMSYYTIIPGILALFLGIFYFFYRLKYDSDARVTETRRQQLKLLSEQLSIYDCYVEKILNKIPSNNKELTYLRNKISKQFELINVMLKSYKDVLKFNENDIDSILDVDSFVDNSEIIMRTPYETYIKESLYVTRDQYIEKIKTAQKICLKMKR